MNIREKTCKVFGKKSYYGGDRMCKCTKKGDLCGARGITLIALIVTIIVLLILAGVSLNLVAGSDGIINKASKAVSETKKATIKEEVELLIAELQMDYYEDYANNKANYSTALDYAKAQLQTGSKQTGSGVTITYNAPKYYYERTEFTIDTNGNVTVGEQTGNAGGTTTPTISPTVTETPSPTATTTPEPEKYTVSYDLNGGSVDTPITDENEYIQGATIITKFDSTPTKKYYNFVGWSQDSSKATADYTSTNPEFAMGTSNVTLYAIWEETEQYYNSKHPELHIPTGFRYLTGTLNEGYVITDAEKGSLELGNEFVWIPVGDEVDYAKKLGIINMWVSAESVGGESVDMLEYDLTKAVKGDRLASEDTTYNILGTNISSEISNSPEALIVNNAGGFWVGRYEAGVESVEHTAEELTSSKWDDENVNILVKQNAEPARQIYQEQALKLANNWKSGEADSEKNTVAFQSGLITGAGWDTMCNFIGWDICDTDCSAWGNYDNNAGSLYTGYHSNDVKNDWIYSNEVTKLGDKTTRWVFATGKFLTENKENTAKNNIYDIAGNVWEWTTEIAQYIPTDKEFAGISRGGAAGNDSTHSFATLRCGSTTMSSDLSCYKGFRIVLYVK